ncbi:MAG: glycosyltransferase family 2 protein [Nitrospiria bacterium]
MIAWLHILSFPFLAAFSLSTLVLGIQLLFLVPLTLVYEIWKRKRLTSLSCTPFQARISVIVPAYNEEKTLRSCLESILASDYPDFEVIVVNDGSTDRTGNVVFDLIQKNKIIYLQQENGGKARALNLGASVATGKVILYTDADSIFLPDTIQLMVRWFSDFSIDAVCGNDKPLTTGTLLQKVLAVTSHIGTGFVRRALSVIGVLPIITGNLGAIRKKIFNEIGGFYPTWGEDLDITFRLHMAKKKMIFDPSPVIRADCPAGLSGLWRQRTRWVRSYLKISRLHKELFNPASALPFSLYFPLNYFTQVIIPILQLLSIPLFFYLILGGGSATSWWLGFLIYIGLLTFSAVAFYSILLDRDWKTFVYLPLAVLLIVPLSYFYNFVVVASIWKEITGQKESWAKINRTGFLLFTLFLSISPMISNFAVQNVSEEESSKLFYPASNGVIALATHFDPWNSWEEGVASILQNRDAQGLNIIGISAGRPEWTYFRWNTYPEKWSSNQKNESVDLLGEAVSAFNKRHFKTVAIVDVYAPGLIKKNPDIAAVRFDGARSPEQVSFTELVDGEYGREVIEMVRYLARNYPLKAIALTEMSYHSFCFDNRCLLSYRKATGNKTWPKNHNGTVDRDDPSIWEWRSAKMEKFIERVARTVHAEGKEFYVDVPVSWEDFSRHGKDSGLDYARILRHADKIVVWNYFDLENLKPDVSLALAKELSSHFAPEKVFVSIGLWGNSKTVTPEEFKIALEDTLKGGIPNIWITPNHLMTPSHWTVLTDILGKPLPDARIKQ